jgi:hypothetical protein
MGLLGMHLAAVHCQRDAVHKLRELGALIYGGDYNPRAYETIVLQSPNPPSSLRAWLERTLGPDHFSTVERVRIHIHQLENEEIPIARWRKIVDQLERLPSLKMIELQNWWPNEFGPEHMHEFAKLDQVEILDIKYGTITGELLAPLENMPRLHTLHFSETDPSPDMSAYQAMVQIQSLRKIWVPSRSPEAQAFVQEHRPDVELLNHGNYAP